MSVEDDCEKSVFLGTKRHPERYECELPEGHDGLHRAEAAGHNFMTGSDAVLLHWQTVEGEDTVGDADEDDGIAGQRPSRDNSAAASEETSEKSEEEKLAEAYRENADFAKQVNEEWTGVEPPIEDVVEDTSGDSEAGLKDRQEERYKTPNESAAASDIPIYGWFNEDPLVRLSDVVSLLEKVEREAEAYTTAEEDPVTAFKHGSEFVLSNIREHLKEFTQNGDTE